MDYQEETLKKVEIYREAARHYFNVRSYITYLNIIGCGAITVIFARSLIELPDQSYIESIKDHFWLYFIGGIAIVGLAAWAVAICNLLSNSFYAYMDMAMGFERILGVEYPTQKKWAVTYEFLTDKEKNNISAKFGALRGNVWNTVNGFVALYGLYALIITARAADMRTIVVLAALSYSAALYVMTYLSISERVFSHITWLFLCLLSLAPVFCFSNFPA